MGTSSQQTPISSAPSRIERFAAWRRRVVPDGVTVLVVATIIGVTAGVAAWFMKWSIGHMADFFLKFESFTSPNYYLLALPFIGIFLTVAYQRWIIGTSIEHGTMIIQRQLDLHNYDIRHGLCYQPLIASVMTLGFGGSAGAEGPIATAGAAIGSAIARLFGLQPDLVRAMIGCGAGAGIGGIFKAPVGGALFTLEVIKMQLSTLTVMALIGSSIAGAMTCYALTGFSFDVQFLQTSFFDPATIGWVFLLGIFSGLYAVYYNKFVEVVHQFLSRISGIWVRALTSSAILAIIVFLIPAMYGEGYGIVTQLVNGDTTRFMEGSILEHFGKSPSYIILFGFAVMLLKVFATTASNSGGGVAGDFAPTIFAGAFCGMVFASGVNHIFDTSLPVGLFALYGMAGAFSGIIHAPLMAMFLVAEMVGGGFGYFLPISVTAVASYITVKIITPSSSWHAGNNHDDLAALTHKKV